LRPWSPCHAAAPGIRRKRGLRLLRRRARRKRYTAW
jgi:hypothetical protein